MNKERYNQIIDEVYKNYLYQTFSGCDEKWLKELDGMNMQTGEKSKVYRQYHKGEFINRIKTDSEFSEKWGLIIKETYKLISHTEVDCDFIFTRPVREYKLIVVYKNEIIEVYE